MPHLIHLCWSDYLLTALENTSHYEQLDQYIDKNTKIQEYKKAKKYKRQKYKNTKKTNYKKTKYQRTAPVDLLMNVLIKRQRQG